MAGAGRSLLENAQKHVKHREGEARHVTAGRGEVNPVTTATPTAHALAGRAVSVVVPVSSVVIIIVT